MVKNLIFHVYPVKDSLWEWNCQQMSSYLPMFNGKRIISIAQDDTTVPLSRVSAYFPNSTIRKGPNQPPMGEGVAFLGNLNLVRSLDPEEMTFYAHAKGVTHSGNKLKEACVKSWASAIYKCCLTYPLAIDKILKKYDTAGCFKIDQNGEWYYAGGFWWVKNQALFSKTWMTLEKHYYGVEQYLRHVIPSDRAYNIHGIGHSLYDNLTPESEYADSLERMRKIQWEGLNA